MSDKFTMKEKDFLAAGGLIPKDEIVAQLEKVYSQAIDHSIKVVEKNLGELYPASCRKIIEQLEKLKNK